jgi:hypothetical protein
MDPKGLILALSIIAGVVMYQATSSTAHKYNFEPDANKKFYVANLADGVDAVSVSTGGGVTSQAVSVASPSLLLAQHKVGVKANPKTVSYSVTGSNGNFDVKTDETKLGYHNLIVTTRTPSGDKVEAKTLVGKVQPMLQVVVDAPINGVSNFDVYVTKAGSLDGAKPVASYTEFGKVVELPEDTIKSGFNYTITLTKVGSTEVLSQVKSEAGLNTGWYRLHAFTHKAGQLVQTKFDVDAWRS